MKDILIRLICMFIPVKKWRKKARHFLTEELSLKFYNSFLSSDKKLKLLANGVKGINLKVKDFMYFQRSYKDIVKKLNIKIKNGEPIRVAFIVNWDSVFAARPIYEKMLKDKAFKPFIVVAPIVNVISEEYSKNTYAKTLKELTEKYDNVLEARDNVNGDIIDYSSEMDMVFLPSNDEVIAYREHQIYSFVSKKILTLHVNYSWLVTSISYLSSGDIMTDTYNLLWKVFTETDLNNEILQKYQPIKAYNSMVVGYCKMDKLEDIKPVTKARKKIIISSHHSIHEIGMCSRFLVFADLFLKLPKMYPDIDFVFRPHPLLIGSLANNMYWGKEKTEKYFEQLFSNPNIILDETGEYFDLFVNSDGMINDCASFLPEYLSTYHPQCYMLKSPESIPQYFNNFAKNCLKYCYQAFEEKDILNFIDNVIVKKNDSLKEARDEFVKQNLKLNYPFVADKIIEYIKLELNKDKTNG